MPIPGLTDIYELSDWLKKNYLGISRSKILIEPVQGGLIRVIPIGQELGAVMTDAAKAVGVQVWHWWNKKMTATECGLPIGLLSVTGDKDSVNCEGCRIFMSSPLTSVEEPAKPTERESDLARSLSSGYASCITITRADSAEGERVVAGWPDDKVREFAKNWVARAEASQRLADEAIAVIRSSRAAPGDVREDS